MDDRERAERLWSRYTAISGAFTLLLGATFALLPATHDALTQEDRFLEKLTVYTFACALGVSVVSLVRRRGWHGFELLLPLAALLAFLDEISFGQRWLEFPLPEIRHFPIDGVHDLFLVAYSVFETDEPLYLALYAVTAVVALGAFVWAVRPKGPARGLALRAQALVAERPSLVYLALAVFFLALAMVLDLDLIEHGALMFFEELLEFQTALALGFGGAAIGLARGRAHGR